MAYTARKEADCKEFFDDPESLANKIKQLAELVKKSKHFCAFTGAGISTAAGIADYRSGLSTVLDTGAGKWAKQAAVKEGKEKQIKKAKKKLKDSFKALPTKSHMALVGLMINGPKYLKYLISQNTDGLHRRSNIPLNQMSELHGNKTMEVCQKCGREYMRDYKCRKSLRKQKSRDHFTGRYCTVPRCNGKLHDTIINFGESLHERPLELAEENTTKCDLMLSLGSSLTVTPAADMPGEIGEKWEDETENDKAVVHNLCIVNLQKTEYDDQCSVRIFAKIDDVMVPLMKELGVEIPDWNLQRFLKVKIEKLKNRDDLKKCVISGVDIDGIAGSIFTKVKLRNNGEKLLKLNTHNVNLKFRPDEYIFNTPAVLQINDNDKDTEEKKNENDDNNDNDVEVDKNKGLVVELSFYGHYGEPNLLIQLNDYLKFIKDDDVRTEVVLRMVFDLKLKKWIVKGSQDQMKDADIGKLWKNFDAKANEEDDD